MEPVRKTGVGAARALATATAVALTASTPAKTLAAQPPGRAPCAISTTIDIADEVLGERYRDLAAYPLRDSAFGRLVRDLSSDLTARAATLTGCKGGRKIQVTLTFIRRPLVRGRANPTFSPPAPRGAAKRLSSPWVNVWASSDPEPRLTVHVFWSERQLLADQATLAWGIDPPPPHPLKQSAFSAYVDAWSFLPPSAAHSTPPSPSVLRKVPADLAWLFGRTDGAGLTDFGTAAFDTLGKVEEEVVNPYRQVVIGITDRWSANPQSPAAIRSVRDLPGSPSLSAYRLKKHP